MQYLQGHRRNAGVATLFFRLRTRLGVSHCLLVSCVLIVLACCQCNLRERVGLEVAIVEAERIRDAQRAFKHAHGRDATFEDFRRDDSGNYRPRRLEDDGYTAELHAAQDTYKLSIREVNVRDSQESLSLYADESGIIRASVDPKKVADRTSDPIAVQ